VIQNTVNPYLSFNNVSYSYPGGFPALGNISFTMGEGSSIGIIGPNGAGKSTLLQLIVGILSHQSGDILLDGVLLDKKTVNQYRHQAGLLFQNPDDQLFCPTIRDDVAFGPIHQGLEGDALDSCVQKALETAGVDHLADRAPYNLSGGEKKAAALASILSMNPELLLLDETSVHLDPRSRRNLINIVKGLDQSKLIVSHDLDFIWECCDQVLILNKGCLVAEGSAREILSDRTLLEAHSMELPLRLQGCPRCSV